jgi:nitrite reductase (NADH) large subunit
MPRKLVVIGNGMAAGRALEELFERAPGAYDVTIFGAEPRVNYNRIMLSPVLSGEKAYEDILIHDDAWYETHGITLHRGKQVVGIDRAAKRVTAADGTTAEYDQLLVATGSMPFVVPIGTAQHHRRRPGAERQSGELLPQVLGRRGRRLESFESPLLGVARALAVHQ